MRRAALASLLFLVFAAPAFATPFTPLEWQGQGQRFTAKGEVPGKLLTWNRDRDHNFIDDLLDGRPPSEKVDVIVDFNRCVTCCEGGAEHEALTFLRRLGKVDHISSIVTFAVVLQVPVSELRAIAERPEVAMVEWLVPSRLMTNVSVPAVRVAASGTFSPNTVQDAFPAITGAGMTIAVIDSGVDNAGGSGTTSNMFPAGTFLGGGNCLTDPCTIGDPDDDNGHGTNVAGIALGRAMACGTATCRGVAPGAGLVDIKVVNSSGSCVGASCIRGLELAINNRDLWGIDVINISLGDCTPSNGQNAIAQLMNTGVALGIFTAVSAGNTPNCGLANGTALINDWASASLALTVAAVDDVNTVPLGNDALAGFSFRGPRTDDGDGDARDEQKPEIAAPGVNIVSAARDSATGTASWSGTSQAAPHVSGTGALILQRFPGINPGSVKELIIATAAQSNKPGPHPGYDVGWGFGFLDAFAAINRGPVTDIGRPTEPPYVECGAGWCSPHISTATPPHISVANTITAQIHNFTATAANPARICFGVYVFSNNFNRFFELGCVMANLPGNATTPVSLPWTPAPALRPPGFSATDPIHACIKVTIDYPFDSNFANNDLQRNVSVAQASIARVPFRLENNTTKEARVELKTETRSDWKARITMNGKPLDAAVFTMKPGDCPKDLIVEMEPPREARKGDKATFILRALTDGKDFGGIVVNAVVAHEDANGGTRWPWWIIIVIIIIIVIAIIIIIIYRRPR